MGSLSSKADDILDEYGTVENYLKKTGYYKAKDEQKKQARLQREKDFRNLTFSEYDRKYFKS